MTEIEGQKCDFIMIDEYSDPPKEVWEWKEVRATISSMDLTPEERKYLEQIRGITGHKKPAPEPIGISTPTKSFADLVADQVRKQQSIDRIAGAAKTQNGLFESMKQAGKISTEPVVDTILDTDDFDMDDDVEDFSYMHPEGIFVAQVHLCTSHTNADGGTYYSVEFETEHTAEFGYVNATAYSKMRGNFNIKVDHTHDGLIHVKVLR